MQFCNICNNPIDDDSAYIYRKSIGYIGDCCMDTPSLAEIHEIASKYRDAAPRMRRAPEDDAKKWYLITLTSPVGAIDAKDEIMKSIEKIYKSKMFKGEKYHAWEVNEHGMLHCHIIFISDVYTPAKSKIQHKYFVDILKLKHKQFNYILKNIMDPKHIEIKERLGLTDNIPDARHKEIKKDEG